MAASSDGYLFYRTAVGSDLTTQIALATGATGSTGAITVRNSLSHIHVQRIRMIPTTYGVGSITFNETDSTGAIIGIVTQPNVDITGTQASGVQSNLLDFGPKGWKMGVGTNLSYTRSSATGPGCNLVIEAYGTASTGPLAMATTN